MARIVPGDLIEAARAGAVDYLVQQTNCLTCRPHGLSRTVADAFPGYGDVYAGRRPIAPRRNLAHPEARPVPGTCALHQPPPGVAGPTVVALHAQWKPGSLSSPVARHFPEMPGTPETAAVRLGWFKAALAALAAQLTATLVGGAVVVGVPYGIGCGLAGGSWPDYHQALDDFAATVRPTGVTVVVFRLATAPEAGQ